MLYFKVNTTEIRTEVINSDSADSTSEKLISEPQDNPSEDNRLTFVTIKVQKFQ